jgi:hypothetical protein
MGQNGGLYMIASRYHVLLLLVAFLGVQEAGF